MLLVFVLLVSSPDQQTTAPASAPAHVHPTTKERVTVEVPAVQQARIGVVVSPVVKKPVHHTIRTVGVVTPDQRTEAHVTTRVSGWIESLYVDYVGKAVRKGDPLYSLYSPDIVSTESEYVSAAAQGEIGRPIAEEALARLRHWNVAPSEIAELKQTKRPKRAVRFVSPVNAVVVRKGAVIGLYVTPDVELYHLADISRVWVIVTLYEYDLAAVKLGDEASITLTYSGTTPLKGTVDYIFPDIEPETRTARARVVVDNKSGSLLFGMYANVSLERDLGEALVVPDAAVLNTGERKIAIVRSTETTFEPREVKVGPRVGNELVILDGLKEGESVVTRASFLIDAESKLRAALQAGGKVPGHGDHGK
ncbi:MAG: efflux RND transporter periplasmic adaptor subunit [Deltaproteobacteria bacterium]|nr:efflux RND transporter periplasmic adaptor subunit [Deltaproteobacteria bacterium]